jgi:hypothetical protein
VVDSPFLASARAELGGRYLKLGNRVRARELAQLSRKAFAEQPEVSPGFKRRLAALWKGSAGHRLATEIEDDETSLSTQHQ